MKPDLEFDTTLGGFPVHVKMWIGAPEPDVGINSAYIEEYELSTVKGDKPFTGKLEEKLYGLMTVEELNRLWHEEENKLR